MNIRTITMNSLWSGAVPIRAVANPLFTLPTVSRAFDPGTCGPSASLATTAGGVP